MIVRVPAVYMGANDKGVVAFEKPLCKLYADTVCFLRRYLAGAKRLPEVIR